MTALDRLIPIPRLLEIDHVDLAAPPGRVWELVRHDDLARSPLVRVLFAVRALPDRLRGDRTPSRLGLDDMVSTAAQPGFQVLIDDPPHEVAVGAIGQVWKPSIPFRHVADAAAYAAVTDPGWIKVAWALRVIPRGDRDARLEIEVRVDATDDEAWRSFQRYFRVIGPGSHLVRRSLLAGLAAALGSPDAAEDARPLPGDELLPDARAQVSHRITIAATPAAIWPWLVQMGRGRAGFYAIDAIDNGGRRSAREVHPELQAIAVGDVVPTDDEPGSGGFEVLAVAAPRVLVLGGLHDADGGGRLRFAAARPARYWHATWAFVLEPLDASTTCLHVRVRAAFDPHERLHVAWIRPAHHFMQAAQLRHLAARAEGRQPRDDWRDVVEGTSGALLMALLLLTPFGRSRRAVWGLSADEAARVHPGDELTADPRWMWTHAVEIDAPAAEVWPWVAQIGADRGGFYSYQWLENLAGCDVRNAEVIHPDWQVKEGDGLRLHPQLPPLDVVRVDPGRRFLAVGASDAEARSEGRPWMTCTWLFAVEPLGEARCRFVSRYRVACSDDLATRLQFGPTLIEPIGFVMDRRMLLGVKERAERMRQPGS